MSKKTKSQIKKSSLISIAFSLSIVMIIAVVSFLNISFFPPKVSLQEIPQAKAAGESWYAEGGTWNYRKKITVDYTKVISGLDYDDQTGDFTIGDIITGASGATATISGDSDSGDDWISTGNQLCYRGTSKTLY